ncbi:hypothetical protein SAMN05443431_103228 [Olleya namhaensis]|uniref:Uncharacterized protein n=1 Tax=Olleya namhaensis TaxID=1144750 RepID=A0A1I3MMX8_9FLAO|nr:hypothetical protein SAMN05443431_103228 [Olleya namhaensis]
MIYISFKKKTPIKMITHLYRGLILISVLYYLILKVTTGKDEWFAISSEILPAKK